MTVKNWILAGCFAVLALPGVPGATEAQTLQQGETRLSVTGEGRVLAKPDMAVISLRVTREGPRAEVVMAEMAKAARAVLDTLEAEGVARRDIQTSALQLSPRWNRHNDGSAPRVVGYEAATGLEIRIRDLDRFGSVLDAVVAEGANGFQGIRFTFSEPRPLEDAARVAAFDDAMAKARLYAEAAGMRVAAIRSISEGGGPMPRPIAESAMMRSVAADVPIASGEAEVVMRVALEIVLEPAPEAPPAD